MRGYFVYILNCSDGSYYVRHTENVIARVECHNEGRAARFTAARLPVRLVWQERHSSEDSAIRRKRQIKRWVRTKKQTLIKGDMDKLHRLAKRKR